MDEQIGIRIGESTEPGRQARELGTRLLILSIQIVSVLIDSLFLTGCVVTNWAADKYVFEPFKLNGIHGLLIKTLEAVFTISTLFPVLVYVTVDLIGIYTRAKITIQTLTSAEEVPTGD